MSHSSILLLSAFSYTMKYVLSAFCIHQDAGTAGMGCFHGLGFLSSDCAPHAQEVDTWWVRTGQSMLNIQHTIIDSFRGNLTRWWNAKAKKRWCGGQCEEIRCLLLRGHLMLHWLAQIFCFVLFLLN
jgi:hypothetical protein